MRLRASTLDGRVRVRWVIDAGNLGRVKMRDSNHDNCRKAGTGETRQTTRAAPPVYTAEGRKTVQQGLRILAKIIARAHLRRQAAWCMAAPGATNGEPPGSAPHGPPPERKVEE